MFYKFALICGMIATAFGSVFGILGNSLTLAIFLHQYRLPRMYRSIKSLTSDVILMTNLAFADLLYSGISLPIMFVTFYNVYVDASDTSHERWWFCPTAALVRYTNAIAEWITLGLMTIQRSINIRRVNQLNYTPSILFSQNLTILYCILTWVAAFCLNLWPVIVKNGFAYNNITMKCDFNEPAFENSVFGPRQFFFSVATLIPIVLLTIGYIVLKLQESRVSNPSQINLKEITQARLQARRFTNATLIKRLILAFIVCVIPICVFNLYAFTGMSTWRKNIPLQDNTNLQGIGILLYCLYYSQYWVNTVIYLKTFDKYPDAMKQLFNYSCCKKQQISMDSYS